MSGIGSSLVSPPRYRSMPPRPRSEGKRTRIIEPPCAISPSRAITPPEWATSRPRSASPRDRSSSISAARMDCSSRSTRRRCVRSRATLMLRLRCGSSGFFEVLRYWLVRTEHLLHEDWIPYRVSLLGNYGTDLTLKREINRFLLAEDPYGTVPFVRYRPAARRTARRPGSGNDRFDSGLDDGAFSGRAAHRRTGSGIVPPPG